MWQSRGSRAAGKVGLGVNRCVHRRCQWEQWLVLSPGTRHSSSPVTGITYLGGRWRAASGLHRRRWRYIRVWENRARLLRSTQRRSWRVRLRRPMRLPTLVALEFPLFHELLCLRADRPIVPIRELTLLGVVNRPPFGADINPTANADLVTRLVGVEGRLGRCSVSSVGLICACWGCHRCRGQSTDCCWWHCARGLRCCRHEVCLAYRACQREIGLLKVLHIKLQCIETRLICLVVHLMYDRFDRCMLLAPNASVHSAVLSFESHYIELVSS